MNKSKNWNLIFLFTRRLWTSSHSRVTTWLRSTSMTWRRYIWMILGEFLSFFVSLSVLVLVYLCMSVSLSFFFSQSLSPSLSCHNLKEIYIMYRWFFCPFIFTQSLNHSLSHSLVSAKFLRPWCIERVLALFIFIYLSFSHTQLLTLSFTLI